MRMEKKNSEKKVVKPQRLRKSERSKIRIMHAAKGLFEEQGMEHVTFNEVAEAADVCRSTVFNYFPSSDDLMAAIYESEIRDIHDRCDASGLEGEEFIRQFFMHMLQDAAYYPKLMVELTSAALVRDEKRKSLKDIEKLLEKKLPHRENLSKEEVELQMIMIIGAYTGIIYHYIVNDLKFDVKKMNKQYVAIIDRLLSDEQNTKQK